MAVQLYSMKKYEQNTPTQNVFHTTLHACIVVTLLGLK